MSSSELYTEDFFAFHEQRSRTSARETIPLVLSYVQPSSIVDVGCGNGTWLVEFKAAGVSDLLGIDGDWVKPAQLLIDRAQFRMADLAQPLNVGREFDMATSLEVAEHLPGTSASTFVRSLVELAPVVLFSAAIPYQGGDGHVNEQYPDYWADLFRQHDYVAVDCLRRALWNNANVAWFYRQNLLFFVDRKRLRKYPKLADAFATAGENSGLSLVHPDQYDMACNRIHELQCAAMRRAARLRQINLVAFPDWEKDARTLSQELRQLLAAIVDHPERQQLTLVINVRGDEAAAAGMMSQLVEETIRSNGRPPHENPEVAGVGRAFGVEEWSTLRDCLQWRVPLANEDQAMVSATKAVLLPAVDVAELRAGKPLAVDDSPKNG
jgi:SAM-dependent methyltransferase